MNTQELLDFTRQLASLIRADIRLINCLHLMKIGSCPSQSKWLDSVIEHLNQGLSFSESLRQSNSKLSSYYCGLIEMGESSGTLSTILNQLALNIERQSQIERKVQKALTYPLFVMTLSISILIGMLLWIVPTFEQVFTQLNSELPLPTRILLNLSQWLTDYAFVCFLIFSTLLFAILISLRRSFQLQVWLDFFMLRCPFFRKISRVLYLSRWCSMMHLLSHSGTPLLDALRLTGYSSGHWAIHHLSVRVLLHLTHGHSIFQALKFADPKNTLFDSTCLQMIHIGESSGNLNEMLRYLTIHYEESFDQHITQITDLLEPILISFMGLLIGSMVVALYLPLFKLGELN